MKFSNKKNEDQKKEVSRMIISFADGPKGEMIKLDLDFKGRVSMSRALGALKVAELQLVDFHKTKMRVKDK